MENFPSVDNLSVCVPVVWIEGKHTQGTLLETVLDYTIIKDSILATAAFVGMGLGIYNFFHQKKKEKVRLQVIPKAVVQRSTNSLGQMGLMTSSNEFNPEYIDNHFAVEVVNMSAFPVIVDNVGFVVKGEKNRMVLVQPLVTDNKPWPRRLESRESVTVYGLLGELLRSPSFQRVTSAFVETSCGTLCQGSSRALTDLVKFSKLLYKSEPSHMDHKTSR